MVCVLIDVEPFLVLEQQIIKKDMKRWTLEIKQCSRCRVEWNEWNGRLELDFKIKKRGIPWGCRCPCWPALRWWAGSADCPWARRWWWWPRGPFRDRRAAPNCWDDSETNPMTSRSHTKRAQSTSGAFPHWPADPVESYPHQFYLNRVELSRAI